LFPDHRNEAIPFHSPYMTLEPRKQSGTVSGDTATCSRFQCFAIFLSHTLYIYLYQVKNVYNETVTSFFIHMVDKAIQEVWVWFYEMHLIL